LAGMGDENRGKVFEKATVRDEESRRSGSLPRQG